MLVLTAAARTPLGKAGTLTTRKPRYWEVVVTSLEPPPVAFQALPCKSGSASTGTRLPQMTSYRVLERLLAQPAVLAHSTGMLGGGGQLFQLVLMSPSLESWKSMTPMSEFCVHLGE